MRLLKTLFILVMLSLLALIAGSIYCFFASYNHFLGWNSLFDFPFPLINLLFSYITIIFLINAFSTLIMLILHIIFFKQTHKGKGRVFFIFILIISLQGAVSSIISTIITPTIIPREILYEFLLKSMKIFFILAFISNLLQIFYSISALAVHKKNKENCTQPALRTNNTPSLYCSESYRSSPNPTYYRDERRYASPKIQDHRPTLHTFTNFLYIIQLFSFISFIIFMICYFVFFNIWGNFVGVSTPINVSSTMAIIATIIIILIAIATITFIHNLATKGKGKMLSAIWILIIVATAIYTTYIYIDELQLIHFDNFDSFLFFTIVVAIISALSILYPILAIRDSLRIKKALEKYD